MVVKVEDFEGLPETPNSPKEPDPDFLFPGALEPFQFPSGLIFLAPIPNKQYFGIKIGDFAVSGAAKWLLGSTTVEDAGDVPSGSAYLGDDRFFWGEDFDPDSMTFGFDTTVYTVGAYVDGYEGGHVRITAYDASGKLITGASLKTVPVEDWGSNYIQVISNKPIDKIVFTGDQTIIDDLKFDTAKPDIIKGKKNGGTVKGTNSDDVILGKKGDEKIKGKKGDDTINGKAGKDKIKGGDGNDTLVDGKGANKIWGNAGQDSFLFKKTHTRDKLKDYNPSDDTIILDQAAFSVLPPGELNPAAYHAGAAATNTDHRMLYDATTGVLRYDEDGSGAIAPIVVAKLPGGLAMTAAEFFIA